MSPRLTHLRAAGPLLKRVHLMSASQDPDSHSSYFYELGCPKHFLQSRYFNTTK